MSCPRLWWSLAGRLIQLKYQSSSLLERAEREHRHSDVLRFGSMDVHSR